MAEEPSPLSLIDIEQRIFNIRGLQVMPDSDLAELYGAETKMINRNVKRNPERFPEEFYFSLSIEESTSVPSRAQHLTSHSLRYQTGTLNATERGRHRKYAPKVFTEQGVAMLSAVLKSDTAVAVSIRIIEASPS